jgi:hypothetical protein
MLFIERKINQILLKKTQSLSSTSRQCSARDIIIRIRIGGSVPLTTDPDPALFVSDLLDATNFLKFFSHFSLKIRYIYIIF